MSRGSCSSAPASRTGGKRDRSVMEKEILISIYFLEIIFVLKRILNLFGDS